MCLLVGGRDIEARIRGTRPLEDELFRFTGPLPFSEIPDLYAASDVGMYPADETEYFHSACPIKVIEYAAAGKPVVAPQLQELMRLPLANVILAEPEPVPFARALLKAIGVGPRQYCVSKFDVANLARRLEKIILDVIAGHRRRS